MDQLSRNLSCEWVKDGIRVNSVKPWYTQTPLVEKFLEDEKELNMILSRTPMGRVATAEEVSGGRVTCLVCVVICPYHVGKCGGVVT